MQFVTKIHIRIWTVSQEHRKNAALNPNMGQVNSHNKKNQYLN